MKQISQLTSKEKNRQGILLYTIVLLSYFIFGVAWIGVANLRGNAEGGWLATYFDGQSNLVVEQIVNYVISFMGGVGSIIAGYFLVKYGHKHSVILAMSLISIAIIAPWLHRDVTGPDYFGFTLFILARLFMSLGGTILIIYLQPIIAHYITNKNTKAKLTASTPLGYNCAIMISYLLISLSPQISQTLFNNWQIVTSAFALPIIVLLILYLYKAEDITRINPQEVALPEQKKTTIAGVFKDKRVLILSGVYTILIVVTIIPIYLFPKMFSGMSATFTSGTLDAKAPYLGYFNWGALYIICFMAGVFISIFIVSFFNKTTYQRKWFLIAMFVIALISFLGSILCVISGGAAIWGALVFGFLAGVALWSAQAIIWTIPFELPNQSPKRIGLIFSVMRSIGYFMLTLFNILFALLADETLIKGFWNGHEDIQLSAIIFAIVFLSLAFLSIPLVLFLPKSNFEQKT